jgi:ABC-type lipoprotein release transport system permease subunit
VLFALYAYRSLRARLRANLLTMLAIILFVTGGSLGLSYYLSLKRMLLDTTPPENIVVLAKGASEEGSSKLDLDAARKVVLLDGVKRNGDVAVATRELVTRVYLAEEGNEQVPIRGIDDQSLAVHRVKVAEGAAPAPGTLEILVGRRVAKRYKSLAIGHEVTLPAGTAKISGIMTADGGPSEDEVWTPRSALEAHLNVKFSSSLTLAASDRARVPELVEKINLSREFAAQAVPATKLLEDGARLGTIAKVVLVLLVLLSIVATFAIATTMNAAVATRMPELAALAAIGIRRGALSRIILLESALLAFVGGLIGVGAGWLLAKQLGAISLGANPVELETSAMILLVGIGLGLAAGIIGGLVPTWRVRRLDIMQAMR